MKWFTKRLSATFTLFALLCFSLAPAALALEDDEYVEYEDYLEEECDAGDDEACDELDDLDTYDEEAIDDLCAAIDEDNDVDYGDFLDEFCADVESEEEGDEDVDDGEESEEDEGEEEEEDYDDLEAACDEGDEESCEELEVMEWEDSYDGDYEEDVCEDWGEVTEGNDAYYEAICGDWSDDEEYNDFLEEELDESFEELGMGIEELAEFIESVETLQEGVENEVIAEALEGLGELIWEVEGVLEDMDAYFESEDLDEETMDVIWEILEEIEELADEYIEMIEEELGADYDLEFDEEYDDEEFESLFDEYYGEADYEDLIAQLEAEIAEELVQQITDALMEELLAYLDDEQAADVITSVMNNVDVLGDHGSALLENSNQVYAVLDTVSLPDDAMYDELRELLDESYTVLADSTHDIMILLWEEVKIGVELGVSEEDMDDVAGRISVLLEDNEDALVFEEGVEYYDVDLDGAEWYYDDVQTLRNNDIAQGFKDANGDLTGFFGPGSNVTYAEVLKMLLVAAGEEESFGSSTDSTIGGQWFEGYVVTAEGLGLWFEEGMWNEEADRETIILWTVQLFGLEAGDTANPFSDVSESDANYDAIIAAYEAGVFTGDDGTGELRIEDSINRAEAAKVVTVVLDQLGSANDLSVGELVSGLAVIAE
jgi:hypothetical protein